MSVKIQKIKPNIGAIVEGLDLNLISELEIKTIQQTLLEHQVIFFRNQQLSSHAQVALAKSFGQLHVHPIYPSIEGSPEIIVLDSHRTDLRDNELWHTDVTFSQTPPLGCVLQAIKIPNKGGDTLWASGTAAFNDLDDALKEQLKKYTATHDIQKSFPVERFAQNEQELEKLKETFRKNPAVTHPVVRTHPDTGQSILFVNEGFTTRINELSQTESDELLEYLFAHAIREEFHIRWQWQEGDVVIWDNRCTQHKALFDYGDAHRIMHRATINGTVPYFQQAV